MIDEQPEATSLEDRLRSMENKICALERWAKRFALPLLERNLSYAESMDLLKILDRKGIERLLRPDLEAREL